MRILFILPRMVSGGVERITLSLIREFSKREGIECAIALRKCHGELLDEARSLCELFELAPKGLHQFVPNLASLIHQWRPTHVVSAFSDIGMLTWLALCAAKSRPRWVHGVHNTHSPVAARRERWGNIRFWVYHLFAAVVYHYVDAIVAVSEGVRSEILEKFDVNPRKVITIYNPVISDDLLRMAEASPRQIVDKPTTLVSLGRLAHQKGFDILIDAMNLVPPPWQLDIWGEGEDRSLLEAKIAQYGLQDAIRLQGYTADPISQLRQADVFVLSSRYEGLPTVLIEALYCQCQIVATDCPQGPNEILCAGALGQLVSPESPEALASAIQRALAKTRRVEPVAMLQRVKQFTASVSAAAWLAVLDGG